MGQFVTNELYHVYNRGVEKRNIFLDDKDRMRFIHDLYEFNDKNPTLNLNYRVGPQVKSMEVSPPYMKTQSRETIVKILAFCLMDNHFHLLIKQKIDNGITMFMHKLGTGYTNSFNKRYGRVGSLFQGKFKAINIQKEEQLIYLPYYIHLNPVELAYPKWKENGLQNYKEALRFLDNYRWSSHLDYAGNKNFPSLTEREFLLKNFGGHSFYKKEFKNWIREYSEEVLGGIVFNEK